MSERREAIVIGAGPVGCVLSVLLSRRGFRVTVYEKRPDLRRADIPAGRSINLVLTRRGLQALELVGLREAVLHLTVPVLGRMMHDPKGRLTYQPYGRDETECNYSVSRGSLNEFLIEAAERHGCEIHFEHELVDADFDEGWLRFRRHDVDGDVEIDATTVFGCDGAPSRVRRVLVESGLARHDVEMLDHGYKEVLFPADPTSGEFSMDGHALHIWPRGEHMLMALANKDRSFTGTVYLPFDDESASFAALGDTDSVTAFFEEHYGDAIAHLGDDFEREFVDGPTGELGTVRCEPWNLDDRVLLVGDAAHGIVPFFGQGLNAGFEDCTVLWRLLDEGRDLAATFAAFYEARKPNTDAIADMALENFVEMRDRVADARFLARKAIEHRIEQAMPEIYRSRYATVMYSHNDYRAAREAGLIQQEILEELVDAAPSSDELDLDRARRLIERKLVPYYEQNQVDLGF